MIKFRYAWIDLSRQEIRPYPISPKLARHYLGGKALAARILYDETSADLDPFSADNLLIINTGVLNGTGAPSSSRFNITYKSILTNGIGSSNCGGNFGTRLRHAGYDGLIITGVAPRPVYLEVLDGEIAIRDAAHLWGLDTEAAQHAFPAHYGKLVIGPAGEHQVWYACVVSEERVGGRGGVGAVFGAKNLKAVVAYGTAAVPVARPEKFNLMRERWINALRSHPATGKTLPLLGTAGLVSKANITGILPVKNFASGGSPAADEVSGEILTDRLLTRNYGCTSCVIRCGRRVKSAGKEVKGPEYETVGLFGPNIENYDFQKICDFNYQADLLGMDTISLGGTLAFAMELKELGAADLGVSFGSTDGLEAVLEDIAHRRGAGDELANGSRWLAKRYGHGGAAVQVKGLEIAAYDPRQCNGMGLGYATANRGGCHLNAGYLAFLEGIGPISLQPDSMRSKPELTILMQNLMDAVSSAGSCLFTTFAAFPPFLYRINPRGFVMKTLERLFLSSGPLLGWVLRRTQLLNFQTDLLPHAQAVSAVMGEDISLGEFLQAGERGFTTERLFNLRAGLKAGDDRLPERMMVPQSNDPRGTTVRLQPALAWYYQVRGWDREGRPAAEKLAALEMTA